MHTLNPEIIDLYISPNYGVAPFPEIDLTMDGAIDLEDINSALGSYPIVQNYYYSPFGEVWQGEKANDTNPFRYAGEYHDSETGSIYLRARYYNPSTGRFITVDPIKDGTNWYVYCNNNPIMFVDPWGLEINIKGSEEEVKIILENLQMLTDDVLDIEPKKNEEGKYVLVIVEERDGNLVNGTTLIRRLVYSPEGQTCTISCNEPGEGNTHQTSGAQSKVGFDPTFDFEAWTINEETGEVGRTWRPDYIGLAHELIHADRHFRGTHLGQTKVSYKYISEIHDLSYTRSNLRYEYSTDIANMEELATVGIRYNSKGDITENMIRAEHGLDERIKY